MTSDNVMPFTVHGDSRHYAASKECIIMHVYLTLLPDLTNIANGLNRRLKSEKKSYNTD
jgi:hypothetical protein